MVVLAWVKVVCCVVLSVGVKGVLAGSLLPMRRGRAS